MTGTSHEDRQSMESVAKSDDLNEKGGEKERITLRLPVSLYARLDELKTVTHASNVNEVLKNALLFYDALIKERLNGNDVFVISPDGEKTKYPVFF